MQTVRHAACSARLSFSSQMPSRSHQRPHRQAACPGGPPRGQIDQLAEGLRHARASLLAQLREGLEGTPDRAFVSVPDGIPGDRADQATNRLLAELDLSRNDRLRRELCEIEAALERLADGTYGHCVDCGEPIDPARLRAWPTAVRCLECQDRIEKTRAGHSTPRP